MQPRKFKAAVLEQLQQPLVVRELELPDHLSVGQILVKIDYSGICGKQIVEMNGTLGPDKFLPHCLGHEGAGTVVAIGPGVRRVFMGDSVVLHWRKGAGIESECPQYWCPELNRYVGGGWVTTFQEYAIVSENRVTRIPADIPKSIAALMGCAVTTGLGIVFNELGVKPGQSVLVLGCGGVGINIIQGADVASADPIIGTDITQEKLVRARGFGATDALLDGPELAGRLKSWFPNGADYVIDTTGRQDKVTLGMSLCANGGTFMLVGHITGDQVIHVDPKFIYSGKRIITSMGGNTDPNNDIPRYLSLYRSSKLDLNSLISMECSLPKINEAFAEIKQGNIIRALVRM